MINNRTKYAIGGYLLLILFGVVGTGAYVVLFGDLWYPFNPDSAAYIEAARNLLAGNGLVQTPSLRVTDSDLSAFVLWPPGFPTLIAIVSLLTGLAPEDSTLLLARAATALVPMTLAFALRPLLGQTPGGIVGLLAFASPLLLPHGFLAMSDVPCLLLIATSLGLLLRSVESPKALWFLLASGLLAGFAYSVRNAAIAYFAAVAATFVLSIPLRIETIRVTARHGVLWILGCLLAVAPMWVRNLMTVGGLDTYAMAPTGGDPVLMARSLLAHSLGDTTGSTAASMLAWDAKWFALLVLPTLALISFALWRQWRGASRTARFGILSLLTYVGAGNAMIAIAATKWFGTIDPRLVIQYTWVMLALLACALVPLSNAPWSHWRKAAALGIVSALAVSYLLFHAHSYQRERIIADTLDHAQGLKQAVKSLPDPTWILRMQLARLSASDRELLATATNLPRDILPISNASYIFRIETGSPVRSLFLEDIDISDALEDEIQKIRRQHRTRPIWLAFLPSNRLVKTGEDPDWRAPLREALPPQCRITGTSERYLNALCPRLQQVANPPERSRGFEPGNGK